jgi:hypothetical protein
VVDYILVCFDPPSPPPPSSPAQQQLKLGSRYVVEASSGPQSGDGGDQNAREAAVEQNLIHHTFLLLGLVMLFWLLSWV